MNPVKHLNNALDMLAHRGLECSGVWDQVIAARDDLLAARKFERRKTVRAKRPVQQAKVSIKPADYEFCPHCYGSFSFAKLGSNFKCKWCKKDVRTSDKLA